MSDIKILAIIPVQRQDLPKRVRRFFPKDKKGLPLHITIMRETVSKESLFDIDRRLCELAALSGKLKIYFEPMVKVDYIEGDTQYVVFLRVNMALDVSVLQEHVRNYFDYQHGYPYHLTVKSQLTLEKASLLREHFMSNSDPLISIECNEIALYSRLSGSPAWGPVASYKLSGKPIIPHC